MKTLRGTKKEEEHDDEHSFLLLPHESPVCFILHVLYNVLMLELEMNIMDFFLMALTDDACGKVQTIIDLRQNPIVQFLLQYAGFIIKFQTLSPEKLTQMSLKQPDLKCQTQGDKNPGSVPLYRSKEQKVHLDTRPTLHPSFTETCCVVSV